MAKKKSLSQILNYASQLSDIQQLELISKISARSLNRRLSKSKQMTWMEMAGLGSEIWKDVDAQEYVKRERESWRE